MKTKKKSEGDPYLNFDRVPTHLKNFKTDKVNSLL